MTFDDITEVSVSDDKAKKGRKIPIELTDDKPEKPVKRGRPRKIKVLEEEPIIEASLGEENAPKEDLPPVQETAEEQPKKWVYPEKGGFISAPNSATFPWEDCADFKDLSNLVDIIWPSQNEQAKRLKTKAIAPFIHNFFNKSQSNEPSLLGDALASFLMVKTAQNIESFTDAQMSEAIQAVRAKKP